MSSNFLGISILILAASGVTNAIGIERHALLERGNFDPWDHMPKYRPFSPEIDGSSLYGPKSYRDHFVPYNLRILRYEDTVRDILYNNNYPGNKKTENKNIYNSKIPNVSNTNNVRPRHTGQFQNKGVIYSRAWLPIPSRQKQSTTINKETSRDDTSYRSLNPVLTDTYDEDPNLNIDNENVPLDDYQRNSKEEKLTPFQNQTPLNNLNEISNFLIAKDRSQATRGKTLPPISTAIDFSQSILNNALHTRVDASDFTIDSTSNTGNLVSQEMDAETASQRISLSKDISTNSSANKTNEYIQVPSVDENMQSTEIPETTILEIEQKSTDAAIAETELNSSTSNSVNDQSLDDSKNTPLNTQSTETPETATSEMKQKSTDAGTAAIELNSSTSNSIRDQSIEDNGDIQVHEQSTENIKTTTLETNQKSTDAEITATELDLSTSNSVKNQTKDNNKDIPSTITQKPTTVEIKTKSTEDSIDLDTSSINTASNSIQDQTTINSKDDESREDIQSTTVQKSTTFEIKTKSTKDFISSTSITHTESNFIKEYTEDNDSIFPEAKDLSNEDEPEHIIQISSIRTVKTVVSVVFLVVALVGIAVLTIYMIKVKRREVQYDQLTLLP